MRHNWYKSMRWRGNPSSIQSHLHNEFSMIGKHERVRNMVEFAAIVDTPQTRAVPGMFTEGERWHI